MFISFSKVFCQVNLNALPTTCLDSTNQQKEELLAFYMGRLSIDSTDQISYYRLGMGYYKLKDLKTAIHYFDKLISLNPAWKGAYGNRGICKLILNDKKGAIEDFKQSIKYGEDSPSVDGLKFSQWLKNENAIN